MPNQFTNIQFTNVGPNKHSWTAEVEWDGEQLIREIKRHFVTNGDAKELTWPHTTPPDIWYDKATGWIRLGGRIPCGTFKQVSATA